MEPKYQKDEKVWYWKRTGELAWGVIRSNHTEAHEAFYMVSGNNQCRQESDLASSIDELKTLYSSEGSRMSWCLDEARKITRKHFEMIVTDVDKLSDYEMQLAIELFRAGNISMLPKRLRGI